MSKFELSPSPRPFVTSGIALKPPVPVEAATPAAERLNHVSIVNVGEPSPGAAPNVT